MYHTTLTMLATEEDLSEINNALDLESRDNNLNPFGVHSHLLDSSTFTSFSIKVKDELVGHAICCGMESDDGSTLEISKLYILENHRHKGYASDAVSQIVDLAREDGITSIFSEPLDKAAHDFWEKTDFVYNKEINRFEIED